MARGLKLLGHLTSPETRSGKVFTRVEQRLTKLTTALAENPTYLRISGGLLRRSLELRIRRRALIERILHAVRLPAASEVDAVRDQLRRLGDQVEALGSQLELAVALLERQQQSRANPLEELKEPRSPAPVSRTHIA